MDRLSLHHWLDLLLADSAEVEHGSHSLPVPSEPDEAFLHVQITVCQTTLPLRLRT